MKNGHYLDLSWVHLLADLNFMKIGSLHPGSHFKENTFPPKAYLNLLNSSSPVCFQDRKSNEDKCLHVDRTSVSPDNQGGNFINTFIIANIIVFFELQASLIHSCSLGCHAGELEGELCDIPKNRCKGE